MAASPETRLRELGFELPEAPAPAGAYVPATRAGELFFTGGHNTFSAGGLHPKDQVGDAVSVEEAREAARLCALNALAAATTQTGALDNISRIVKVTGFVASAPGFDRQPEVLNGASELLGEVFGEAGLHARSAIGVAELPMDVPVEVELVVVPVPVED